MPAPPGLLRLLMMTDRFTCLRVELHLFGDWVRGSAEKVGEPIRR